MAQVANTFASNDAVGNREDLSDVIYNISPSETPFLSMIGKGKSKAVVHEWQQDALAAADGDNAHIEGDEYTYDAVSPTVRLTNICQISRKSIITTKTQEAVVSAGRGSEIGYQANKKIKELKLDMETILLGNQAKVAGDDATARRLRPLTGWISTNADRGAGGAAGADATAATDGTQRALTEDMLTGVIEDVWDAGGKPDCLLMGLKHKKIIGGFSGFALQREQGDKLRTLNSGVDVYVTEVGDSVSLVPCRNMRKTSGNTREIFVLQKDQLSVDYLRPVGADEPAKTGDSKKKIVIGEYTLRCGNEAALGVIADLNVS